MRPILHIITGLTNGGAEAVLYRLVTNDKKNRHVVISMMGMEKYGALLEESGILVYTLDMPKGKITFKGIRSLWRLIRTERPAIIQTWMYHADLIGGIVGRLAGVKKIFWCIHNSTLVAGLTSSSTLFVTKLCAPLSYVIPNKIISCAEKAIEVNVSQGYSGAKFSLVPNGYDLAQFKPDPDGGRSLRNEWQIPHDTFLLGLVARFDPQKDVLNLIKALGIVHEKGVNFHLVLVGTGMEDSNSELRTWLRENNILQRVSMIGQSNDIPLVMNALDVLTLSSKYGEAFPNVLCEAMACGTPCIATSVGDSAFIIADTGWVVPPNSHQMLADAILKAEGAWRDKSSWQTMSENARERIAHNFSIQNMVEGYQKVWGT